MPLARYGGEFVALTQTLQNNGIKIKYFCPFSSAQTDELRGNIDT